MGSIQRYGMTKCPLSANKFLEAEIGKTKIAPDVGNSGSRRKLSLSAKSVLELRKAVQGRAVVVPTRCSASPRTRLRLYRGTARSGSSSFKRLA